MIKSFRRAGGLRLRCDLRNRAGWGTGLPDASSGGFLACSCWGGISALDVKGSGSLMSRMGGSLA